MFISRKLLLAITLILFALAKVCLASYPGYAHGQLLEIVLPQATDVEDFSYRPTIEGYKFSYTLSDGSRHEEMAFITDPKSPEAIAYIMSENARRNRPRPMAGTKNRKLSPKSLQSLAG